MGPIGNRRNSTHDIYVGKSRFSAKPILTRFIAQAKLDKILKNSLDRDVPKGYEKMHRKLKKH